MAENPTPLLDGRHALVIGLGRTGLSLARSLPALGARVRAADRRTSVAGVSTLEPEVEIVLGRDGPDLLAGIDLVVPSPGVPADAAVLTEAVRRGIPVRSEIEVAFLALDAPVLAVTGTNGKSTTTSLLGAMLEQAGFRVFTGGNLGTPLIDAIGGGFDLVVAEVSSFQLEWVDAFRPAVGLLLNVTDDHLDRYRDFSHYAETKARIFARQREADLAVLNRDDPWVAGLAARASARVATFGRSAPTGAAAASRIAATARIEETEILLDEGDRTLRFTLANSALSGAHNQENAAAALLAARAFRAPVDALQRSIDGFPGLRHRMEYVASVGGVRFVDDSKGTNVGALLKSLESCPDGATVLLAGGLAKGGDFAVAREAIARKVRCLVLYGAAREELREAWGGATEIVVAERFADAFARAADAARPGDLVLLSPACASMDQFEDYAARGDAFARLARERAGAGG